jgi:cytochrome P450
MGTTAHELHAALTIDLQRNAAKVVEAARSEVTYSFQRNLLACHDWTAVPVFPTFLKVSALLIERTWVGLPLSREEAWIKATTSYMTDVAKAAGAIRPWSKLLRPFVAPFLSEVQSLKKNRDDVTEMMKPLIHAQFGSRQQQKPNIAGGELFTWIIQRYKGKVTPERIARDELMATFSSLYTVTATLTQTLFDLATHPEYLNPLREELATILAEDAELMQKQSLLKLKKMDSFVKESQRMNPLGLSKIIKKDIYYRLEF